MRLKISTGLTIHNKLFLSIIGHSSVSMRPMPNTSPIDYSRDPHASLFQLTGIKREPLVLKYLTGDVTGQTGHHTDANIGCTERSAVHSPLESICDEHMSCDLSEDSRSKNQ